MRFMLADVEPLAIIVGWPPWPILIHGQEPGVISLAEFRQRLCSRFLEDIEVVVAVVTFDRFSSGISEVHRRIPLLLHRIWPRTPFPALEGRELVVSLGSGKVE